MGKHSKKMRIVTLGCKVNQYESAYIRSKLLELGWIEAGEGEPCDLIVVNTCAVTQEAAHQSRQAISKVARNKSRHGCLVVTGCYAQVAPEVLGGLKAVDIVVGNPEKTDIPHLIAQFRPKSQTIIAVSDIQTQRKIEPLPVTRFFERTRAFLKIQDGCDSFCAYCIVPHARGKPRSLRPGEVIDLLEAIAGEGYKEVVLTGIHLGKYGVERGEERGLVRLLRSIGACGLDMRIRLSSLEPGEISEDLIEIMATEEWLCPHLHIPLQAGDMGVLEKMGREYSPKEFEALVLKIERTLPLAAIGVDVMAGFPGETEKAFANTMALIQDLPISYLHVFRYSRRPGTKAAELPEHLSPRLIKERAKRLRDLGREKKKAFYKRCVGFRFKVLSERKVGGKPHLMRGFTENYLETIFSAPDESTGKLFPVEIKGVVDQKATAEIIS